MKKIKLIYLITALNRGGAETQLKRIVKNHNYNRFEPIVVSLMAGGIIAEELRNDGIRVYELGLKKELAFFKYWIKWKDILKKEKPDIIISFLFHATMWTILTKVMYKNIIIISSIRNENMGSKLREFMFKITDNLNDATTINSYIAAECIINKNIVKEDKLLVIENGIDIDYYKNNYEIRDNYRTELGISSDCFVWMAAGRMHKQKNYDMMINSFEQVCKQYTNTVLLIAGEGELYNYYKEMINSKKLESHIILLGMRSDLDKLLNVADGFLLSSSWEGLPNVLIEASCKEIPIVSTSVGGVKEIVKDNSSGYIVECNNYLSMTNKMIKVMNLSLQERKQMGHNGKKNIESKFDIKLVINKWENLYYELLAKKKRIE